MKNVLTLLVLVLATALFAERQPYARYETIVDRQMFGQPPPGFDPTKMPSEVARSSSREEKVLTQEQEAVRKSIRFTGINNLADGAVVSLEDYSDPKSPHYYLLKVGESQNGWTVKAYDAATETLTVEHDGIEATVKLGGDSAATPDAAKGPAAATPAPTGRASLFGRGLRARRADEAAKQAEEEKARAEAEKRRDAVQSEIVNELQRLREERQREQEAQRQAESSGARAPVAAEGAPAANNE